MLIADLLFPMRYLSPTVIEILFIAVALGLALLVALRVELTRARGGKILAFVTLFIVPALAMWLGFSDTWSGRKARNSASPAM